jgi:hypothetical protein
MKNIQKKLPSIFGYGRTDRRTIIKEARNLYEFPIHGDLFKMIPKMSPSEIFYTDMITEQ